MLKNLTNRLVKDNIKKCEEKLLIEAIVIPTEMSKVERYSLLTESECANVDCNSIKNILDSVTFDESETFEERKSKLYNACRSKEVLTEDATESKKIKKLTMTKEDYTKMSDVIKTYKSTKDDAEKDECKKKIKSFINTIKSSIDMADEKSPADAFINSLVSSIYKVICDGKDPKAKNVTPKDLLIAKITLISKSL